MVDSAAPHDQRLLGLQGFAAPKIIDRQHLNWLMSLMVLADGTGETTVGVGPAVEIRNRAGVYVDGPRTSGAGFPVRASGHLPGNYA
jgi:hypothetical protein